MGLTKSFWECRTSFRRFAKVFEVKIVESEDSWKMFCLEWVEDVIFWMRSAENDWGCVLDMKDMCPIVDQKGVKMRQNANFQAQRHSDRITVISHTVRGTPYTSDSRLPSASAPTPTTSSLFRNTFSRMTSYATRSQPASLPTRLPLMTRWHDTYAVPYTYLLISDLSLISIILYIRPHLQVDPYPFLFGSPARYVCD